MWKLAFACLTPFADFQAGTCPVLPLFLLAPAPIIGSGGEITFPSRTQGAMMPGFDDILHATYSFVW